MGKKVQATLSDELFEAGEILRERRGYRNWSEYLASFVRHDAMVQPSEHKITEPIAIMKAAERDELDGKLLEMVKSEKGERGSWMKKCIYDTIKELMAESGGCEPRIHEVEARLPPVIIEKLRAPK
jgi:hypothetical protein